MIDVRFFSRALHADRCSDFPTKCRCHRGGRHTKMLFLDLICSLKDCGEQAEANVG